MQINICHSVFLIYKVASRLSDGRNIKLLNLKMSMKNVTAKDAKEVKSSKSYFCCK